MPPPAALAFLACQWAKALGANVIGTVGSQAKADLAMHNGCDHVILYNDEDFVAAVKKITRGELCDVVYGRCWQIDIPGFTRLSQAARNVRLVRQCVRAWCHHSPYRNWPAAARYSRRARLWHITSPSRRDLLEGADTLFAAVISGAMQVPIHHAYALKDAARGAPRS